MRFLSWSRRRRREDQLEEEIKSHLEMAAHDLRERGQTAERARADARRQFGNIGLVKEATRAMWGWVWLEQVGQDLRYATRMLRRSPGFTAVAVLSLAIAIGANTAIFSVIQPLMLANLPVNSPEQLVMFRRVSPSNSDYVVGYPAFEAFRSHKEVFSGVFAILDLDRCNLTVNTPGGAFDEAKVRMGVASGNYFSVLGVSAVVGRTFGEDEDRLPDSSPVTVISYRYWERRFGLASDIVGRTIALNGTTYSIIGVTPRGFFGDSVGQPMDLWIPTAMMSEIMPEFPPGKALNIMEFRIVARLNAGVTIKQAQSAGQVILQQLETERLMRQNANPTPERMKEVAYE